MSRVSNWLKTDASRGLKLWVVYLGLISLGALIALAISFGYNESRVARIQVQNMQERAALIELIETRLPAVVQAADQAARKSQEASTDAKAAVGAAEAVLEKTTP